ncbi:P-loop containing nucleoside triphosphate hydrolase protein [Aureobasidium sp. EXF-12298]|nr:P-loop containing nucleoside triphosphate hydrolase protein [Aureobasidium sp. EXF-12298]KAI4781939.1 P-loop containing nucleoside triphosphate hydrolase protein [Aureobasidium sp. EXF-3400]
MVLAKSKQSVGLGNALMNDRFKNKNSNQHKANAGGIQRKGQNGETYITNNKQAAAYEKMRSVTEQGDLDEFLSTAELAGTDFTAEKMNNVKIIHRDQKNPYLLSSTEERNVVKKHNKNRSRLTVPRRPKWDSTTTKDELNTREKEAMIEWRRDLAELQENQDLLLTPFERNLEVWRQLWRVIERSDLVVQIVDARNPLMFRSEDMESYVKEVDPKKRNLLLVNKSDMMTLEQRQSWAKYFIDNNINFRFFSAELARELNDAKAEQDESQTQEVDSEDDESEDEVAEALDGDENALEQEAKKLDIQDAQEEEAKWVDEETVDDKHAAPVSDVIPMSLEEATRILTTEDLEALFLEHAPKMAAATDDKPARKVQIGLVGYPNVGKSSTINALLGAKKVSVSATPGKTKHFQTIHYSDQVVLCDCPGLVFPNFAFTKAELTCNGVLPIDQMREYTGPATLVAQRIPKPFLEAVYGININIRSREEGGTGTPTGEELLRAYAAARGFFTQGLGQPDESRAARLVLKDYVKGKLLFVHPPPAEPPIDHKHFNRELYDYNHLPQKRRLQLAAMHSAARHPEAQTGDEPSLMENDDLDMIPISGAKTQRMDKQFFAPGQGRGQQNMPFHHKYTEQGQKQVENTGGKMLTGRKAKIMVALEKDMDPDDVKMMMSSKKHFKANKRAQKKVRSEYND